jgi:hypothetical protein
MYFMLYFGRLNGTFYMMYIFSYVLDLWGKTKICVTSNSFTVAKIKGECRSLFYSPGVK